MLTGSEYRRMATNKITIRRRRMPMKTHLNLRHTMNFIVLHGFVNQRKDVSGRLYFGTTTKKVGYLSKEHRIPSN